MTETESLEIVWTERASNSFACIVGRLREYSDELADSFIVGLHDKADQLKNYPKMFQKETFYPDNPGNIRRFFCYQYRVIYEVFDKRVVILDIFHMKEDHIG